MEKNTKIENTHGVSVRRGRIRWHFDWEGSIGGLRLALPLSSKIEECNPNQNNVILECPDIDQSPGVTRPTRPIIQRNHQSLPRSFNQHQLLFSTVGNWPARLGVLWPEFTILGGRKHPSIKTVIAAWHLLARKKTGLRISLWSNIIVRFSNLG